MKPHIAQLIEQALAALAERDQLSLPDPLPINIDRTRDPSHGDLASNIALVLSKAVGLKPRDLAEAIVELLPASEHVSEARIAGPGFINFVLTDASSQAVINRVLSAGARFGHSDTGQGQKVQVEFVSANPTGPLHVGHGRGAAVGDCIARLLEATGWDVCREFYYNDAGQQINNLALSVQARCQGVEPEDDSWPEDGYRGDYIIDVAQAYLNGTVVDAEDQHVTAAADAQNLDAIRQFAVAYLRKEQDADLRAFGVGFNVYFLESSLYDSGAVEHTVAALQKQGHCYEKDGALWLKTTDFGDDKDRVMRKSDGAYTYFLPDVAYHKNKWDRGFSRVINEQGADHHSTVTRVRAGLQALDCGIPEGWPEYVLHQMVTVMRAGSEVKISKRAGGYLTLSELVEEVGCDATRYFLAARAPSSQLTFDIDLALAQTSDNPVYYIQYAHARTCSVERKLREQGLSWSETDSMGTLNRLDNEAEKAIMARLDQFPEMVLAAAHKAEPHAVANYLKDLAAEFHTWYNGHKMLIDDSALRDARLSLCFATRQVLANGLTLLGVTAPEAM